MKTVLSLCDFTGNAVKPWAEAGYHCITVDIRHFNEQAEVIPNVERVGADILRYIPDMKLDIVFVFAFPPCTHLAVSGARWFKGKGLDALADSISIVSACARIAEASNAPYLIENPVSTLSTYWRKPDYMFNPHEYAGYLQEPDCEAYTKKTCLWTGGGFVMPEKKPVEPVLGSIMHTTPPSDARGDIRSVTPMGFAQAIFEANTQYEEEEI